jgi:hypothetical protein
MHTEFWWKNLWETGHLEDLRCRRKDNIERGLQKIIRESVDWILLALLTFEYHKRQGNFFD